MKTLLTIFYFLFLSLSVLAQSPEAFNYQGVARDNAGNVLANQNVGLKFSILDSDGTTVLYSEDWLETTNDFGLFNVQIGNGTVLSGTFNGIGWDSGTRFVKVEMDPAGGTAYQNLGTSQLLSVPYALHASSSDDGLPGGSSGNTLRHNGAGWISASNLYNDGTNIGVGTTTPESELHVKDGDTPTLRLEQDNSSFPAQTWDVGGNEVNFFVRDVTNSNALPFRIRAGATANSLYISETGNVGVGGITTPNEKLVINGNLRFPNSSSSIFAASAFNIESTAGVDVIIDNDDNSTNSSFRIKRNGESETIFEVKESGSVEASGEYTYSSARTHYQSFSWHSFAPLYPQVYEFGQSGTSNTVYGEFVSGGLGLGYAVAQLNLPDGAELTNLRAWIWDNASDAPVRVRLLALPLGSETASVIAGVESSSATANAAVQELTVDPNTTINNSSNSYFLRFEGKQNSNDTRLYGVRVTYTVEKAD